MKFSTRSRYGVRLMIELAVRFGRGPVLLKEVAQSEDISEKYLSQLVIPLKGRGLLAAYRGAHGGYVLGRPPVDITLKDIVEPLEGDLSLADNREPSEEPVRPSDAVMRDLWKRLGGKVAEFLGSFTLEDLVRMRGEKDETQVNYII